MLFAAAASIGCGKPFNVKPRTELAPARYVARAEGNNLSVQAQAITDEDFLYETFDGNLISAGVLPVRVALSTAGGETVDLKDARFEVRSRAGKTFKAAKPSDAFKRLVSYYGISNYNKDGYRRSRNDFIEYGLDRSPLAAGQSRHGLLFFLMPSEAARETGLLLSVSRGPHTLELKLN